jgi:hypothetical protein
VTVLERAWIEGESPLADAQAGDKSDDPGMRAASGALAFARKTEG